VGAALSGPHPIRRSRITFLPPMNLLPPEHAALLRPRSRWRSLLVPREELEAENRELRRMWVEAVEELTWSVTVTLGTAVPCPVCGDVIAKHDVCLVSVVEARQWQLVRLVRLWLAVRMGAWERCRALGAGRLHLGRDQMWVWVVACGEEAGVFIARTPARGERVLEVPLCEGVRSRPALDESIARAGRAWSSLDDDWSGELLSRR